MSRPPEELEKTLARPETSSARVVLEWMKQAETQSGQAKPPQGEALEPAREGGLPPDQPGPTYDDCLRALEPLDRTLRKLAGDRHPRTPGFAEAMTEYDKLRKSVDGAIKARKGRPEKILEAIGKLESLFRSGLELLPSVQTKAARTELDSLKERSGQADSSCTEAYKAAEKRGLFELQKQSQSKLKQIELLKENQKKEPLPKKKSEYDSRIGKANEELADLDRQLELLAELRLTYEAAQRESDQLKQALQLSQQRADDLARQQATQQKLLLERAAGLEGRCQRMAKASDLPESIRQAQRKAAQALEDAQFVKAEWALDELQELLEAEEKGLREAHPQRELFLEQLDALQGPMDQVIEDELISKPDQAQVEKSLASACALARQGRFAEALKQAEALEKLLGEVTLRIAAARKAQEAFEQALDQALDDIGHYRAGEVTVPEELKAMEKGVQTARSFDDFAAALRYVQDKLSPLVKKYLVDQEKWRDTRKPPRERKPPSPPNYDEAADWVVQQVLTRFGQVFDYAGPSVDVQANYPRERYDPVRLKRFVRRRFDGLTPATALTGRRLSPRCYFNLGAGGTTKKAYEYNVKVKLPGVDRALAQIHIVYP